MENIQTVDVVKEAADELAAERILSAEYAVEAKQDETDIGGEGLVEDQPTVH